MDYPSWTFYQSSMCLITTFLEHHLVHDSFQTLMRNFEEVIPVFGTTPQSKCEGVESSPSSQSNDNGEKETGADMISFYWSFIASYITILLAFITVLCINARWRMAWFYYISKFMWRFFSTFPLYWRVSIVPVETLRGVSNIWIL